MKKYGHTGTLFIQHQNWKYKWSYKYDHCRHCWTCNFKHKWRWLCTSCWDKERAKKKSRILVRRKASKNRYSKHFKKNPIIKEIRWKIIKILNQERRKEMNRKRCLKWRSKNKEVINIKQRVKTRQKKWLYCMEYRINWKTIFLPFEDLWKPINNLYSKNHKQYEEWKQNMKDFEILKKYYKNK